MTTVYSGLPGAFTAYKVVAFYEDNDNRWCSSTVVGDARVVYEVGQPAQAPGWLAVLGYFVTAFDSLAHAAQYWDKLGLKGHCAVFACEGLYAEPLPPRTTPWSIRRRTDTLTSLEVPWLVWPEGTIMVQRLTLLERVPEATIRALVTV